MDEKKKAMQKTQLKPLYVNNINGGRINIQPQKIFHLQNNISTCKGEYEYRHDIHNG